MYSGKYGIQNGVNTSHYEYFRSSVL